MSNYELTVERKITYTVQVEANSEEEASQKVLGMTERELGDWASDEDTEVVDVFELE